MNSSLLRRTLALALPVALQMLLQSMLGMADVSMVSGLGTQAVAAVGLAAKLHFLLLVLMLGIAAAGGALVAQYCGADGPASGGVTRTLAVTFAVGLGISGPLVLLFAMGPWWASFINPDPAVSALTGQFLLITAPVLLFTQITVIYEAALRSIGNMIVPLLVGALAVLANILFNYIFIFGHFGFDAMGVVGAAWGTLLARLLQVLVLVAWVYGGRHAFGLSVLQFKMAASRAQLARFAAFSAPMVVNYGLWGLGNTVYHVLMGFAGTEALAIMGVMVPVESAFFATFMGVSSACAVMIGQALGANRLTEARQLQRFFMGLAVGLAVGCAVLLWLAKPLLAPLFGQLAADALALLFRAIDVFCLLVVFKVMNMLIIIGVLRAGGDNHFCLKVDTLVMWGIGLPIFAIAVYLDARFLILYALLSLEDLIKLWPFAVRMRHGFWLKNLTAEET